MYRIVTHGFNVVMAVELDTGTAVNVISVDLAKELCEDFESLRLI